MTQMLRYGKFRCSKCEATLFAALEKGTSEFEHKHRCSCGGKLSWVKLSSAPFTEMSESSEKPFGNVAVIYKGEGWTGAPSIVKMGRRSKE